MELADVLKQMTEDSMNGSQLTDLKIGTVTKAKPLEISVNPAMPPLKAGVLYLTAAVVERKIPILAHSHTVPASTTGTADAHSHTIPSVTTGSALDGITATENGKPLPAKDGFIILNRGLEIGDKVLMLRVMRGQRYVVLSRVMEVS